MKKLRIIVNGVSFYASANAISRGVGDDPKINASVRACYADLIQSKAVGVGGTDIKGNAVQITYVN
jgi:hypothetical protein